MQYKFKDILEVIIIENIILIGKQGNNIYYF